MEVLSSLLENGTLHEVEDTNFLIDKLVEDLGTRKMMARVPSFMKALVFWMACRPEVKARELGAFRLQSMVEDEQLLQDVASGQDFLQAMLSLLDSGSEDTLETAAAVLCNLASDPMARKAIANVPEALPKLASLSNDIRERVQKAALNALRNLAKDAEIGIAIARTPGGAGAMAKLRARCDHVKLPFYRIKTRECDSGKIILVFEAD